MRLIDADDIVYESIDSSDTNRYECYYGTGIMAVRKEDIDAMPTIEERKTGKWIYIHTDIDGNALYECSECHKGEVHVPIVEVKYCWNCGAKMEG